MTESTAAASSSAVLLYRLTRATSVRLATAFAAAGMPDLHPRHALQFFPPLLAGGQRVSDLAPQIGVTRQATAQVVGTLERGGYLVRVADPTDRRAKLICLTDRGRAAFGTLRDSMITVEQDWARILGAGRANEFREILASLLDEAGSGGGPLPG
ncbi:MarR family winged helix-turn-helix transcriptional regulator [Nocardia rhamnosiphila]|jgi:DNA-binding MarR family transcriptional regulator|uniref:MarR family transcriptional regulator n=1 Tax=Nocardia rhamnosiphila TaxID=426716 RepID=A0ABV2WPD1_9NOCA|nr:MarR family transcriptional regulator [Nocardia rhamnosiphila]